MLALAIISTVILGMVFIILFSCALYGIYTNTSGKGTITFISIVNIVLIFLIFTIWMLYIN